MPPPFFHAVAINDVWRTIFMNQQAHIGGQLGLKSRHNNVGMGVGYIMTHRNLSLYLLCGAVSMLCSLTGPAQAAAPTDKTPTIVIKAAHLFDSVSGKLTDHGVVVVSGGRIVAVGGDASATDGARVIDLGDATLLPGFIDAHVHLSDESSDNWYRDTYQRIQRFPAEQALYGAHYAKITLEAGVTTVRDLGSNDYVSLGLRNAINAGMVPGPRMLIANYAIGSTGGHADSNPYPPQTIAPRQ